MFRRLFFLVIILFIYHSPVLAQTTHAYNLSTLNGMPTNYVYTAITDQWGYLWMATEKGVVKYNGYSLKLFNYADGLTSEDVYGLQKDRRGRIWLYDFSGKLGHIYNDKYKALKNYSPHALTRVHNITPYKNDILFNTTIGLYTVRNDSIIYLHYAVGLVNRQGRAFNIADTGVTIFRTDANKVSREKICRVRPDHGMRGIPMSKYILFFSQSSEKIQVFDPEDCSLRDMFLYDKDGRVDSIRYLANNETSSLMAFSKRNIYDIDTDFTVRRTTVRSIVDTREDLLVLNYLRDTMWGQCITTRHNGLYILFPKKEGLAIRTDVDLSTYKPVGTIGDTAAYWWSVANQQLLKMCKGQITVKRLSNVISVSGIHPLNGSFSILCTGIGIKLIHNVYLTLESPISLMFLEGKILNLDRATMPAPAQVVFTDSLNGFATKHMLPHRLSYTAESRILSQTPLDSQTYHSLFYDNARGILVFTGEETTCLFHLSSEKKLKIPMSHLNRIGIQKVLNLLYMPTSNIVVVQEHSAVHCYNLGSHRLSRIFTNLNMQNARLAIKGDRVLAAGKFGLAMSRITPSGQFIKTGIYPNIKEQYYSEITGMQIVGDTLHLNTDRGLYDMSLSNFAVSNTLNNYKLLGYYSDSTFSLRSEDTLYTTQENNRLLLDVVNAYGSGTLRFSYRISGLDSDWTQLVANEMVIPVLEPGLYHKAYISMSDDVWNSDPVVLYFYIEPYWWQTKTGRRSIWAGSILLLSGLLFSVYSVTRSAINRNNRKRNKLLELEVKSVYAQINPHFIFNSLNSALSYIELNKNDEAHSHISRFSGLLRGFINSSRNRYTTVADEVANLKNYVELEQTRFTNSFTYEIIAPPQLQGEQIPTLLLQPLVENAINHGLLPREAGGYLRIAFDKRGKDLVCIIEDNGIGRKKSRELREHATPRVSYGTLLIADLIDVFNKYEKTKIDISYTDKTEPETGLIVKLTFKNS
jgi:hypothetical protein